MKSMRWKSIRKGGKRRFVLLHGMMGWGLVTAVIWVFIMGIMAKGRIPLDMSRLWVAFVIFPLAGIVMGLVLWNHCEAEYRKTIKREISDGEPGDGG